jgi:transcriptional regulator with XRE-family HTH domain
MFSMGKKSSGLLTKQPSIPAQRRFHDDGATAGAVASASPETNVGRRLRALRTEHGLSIRALAEMSGLNFNTLGLIENGKCSPSVSTLQQLALGLTVPITAFFETDAPKKHLAYVQVGQRADAAFAHGTLADLGAGLAERAMEPFVITLAPNLGSGQTPIVHTGHEFVFCLAGRLLYTIENQAYLLTPGDSLLFEAHLPHCWQNVDVGTTQALLVLCPADERDQPTALHFALK